MTRLEGEVQKYTCKKQELSETDWENLRFIAQNQLLDFLKSKRYKVTPRNVANAMAGLPDISWQYSFRRTKAIAYPDWWAPRENYSVVQAIEYILRKRRSGLPWLKLFQTEIQKLPQEHEFAKDILLKNWADLSLAIKECSVLRIRTAGLPYRLASTFFKKRSRQKTALDRVLDDVRSRQAFSRAR